MENYLPLSLVVLSGAMFVLAVLFSVALFQIWRAAKNIAALTETLNGALPEILANVRSITVTLNETASTVRDQVGELSTALEKIEGIGNLAGGVPQLLVALLGQPLFKASRALSALVGGLRVFARVWRGAAKE